MPALATHPNLFVLGFPNCGTTSLYHYLREHPEIFMCPVKEPHFFSFDGAAQDPYVKNRFCIQSADEYTRLFANACGESVIGEASTSYIRSATAPARIRRFCPQAKLIISLRNPVDQALSSYFMAGREGKHTAGNAREFFADQLENPPRPFYADSIARYQSLFPPEQLHVFLYEEFRRDPASVCQRIYEFLEVDEGFSPNVARRYNVGGIPRSVALERVLQLPAMSRLKMGLKTWLPQAEFGLLATAMRLNRRPAEALSEDMRQRLLPFYRADILRVEQQLGLDLSAWLDPHGSLRPVSSGDQDGDGGAFLAG